MNKFIRLIVSLLFALGSALALAEPLDINTASAEQLSQVMVGVGKVKAAAIVKDREQNGQFKSVDDLTRVKGVKANTVEKNRHKITVGQANAEPSEPARK